MSCEQEIAQIEQKSTSLSEIEQNGVRADLAWLRQTCIDLNDFQKLEVVKNIRQELLERVSKIVNS